MEFNANQRNLLELERFFKGHTRTSIRKVSEQKAELTGDKLSQIFAMQEALDQRIIQERGIERTDDEWVIGLTIAMESEIDEIRREVNWKWWKNEKPIDRTALQGEVIDMWHFLVSSRRK